MTGESFLYQVHRAVSTRETKRTVLFGLSLFFAFATVAVLFLLVSAALAVATVVTLLGCFVLESWRKPWWKRVTLDSAAREIDERFPTKDRAQAYADLLRSGEAQIAQGKLIDEELTNLLRDASPEDFAVLCLSRRERYFAGVSSLSFLLSLLILSLVGLGTVANTSLAPEVEALHELLQEESLPEPVREKIEQLVDAIAREPQGGEPLEQALEEAKESVADELENFDSASEAPSPTPEQVPPPEENREQEQKEEQEQKDQTKKEEQEKEQGKEQQSGKKEGKEGKEQKDSQDSQSDGDGESKGEKGPGEGKDQSEKGETGEQSGQQGEQQQKQQGDSQQQKKDGQGEGQGGEGKDSESDQGKNQQGEQSKEGKGESSEQQTGQQGEDGQSGQQHSALQKAAQALQQLEQKLEQQQRAEQNESQDQGQGQNQPNAGEQQKQRAQQSREQSVQPPKEGEKPSADEQKGGGSGPSGDSREQDEQAKDSPEATQSSLPQKGESERRKLGDEGTEGLDEDSAFEDTVVGRQDEMFDTRFIGKEGQQVLAKEAGEAKTEFENVELARPESRNGEFEQEMPLEYRGLFRGGAR